MKLHGVFLWNLCLLLTVSGVSADPARDGDAGLAQSIETVCREFSIPGAAGAYVTQDGRIVAAVAGVRKKGAPHPVHLDDPFHVGPSPNPLPEPWPRRSSTRNP